ncbi:hypothetical protein M8494_21410 [Serratia ureilytica]
MRKLAAQVCSAQSAAGSGRAVCADRRPGVRRHRQYRPPGAPDPGAEAAGDPAAGRVSRGQQPIGRGADEVGRAG